VLPAVFAYSLQEPMSFLLTTPPTHTPILSGRPGPEGRG
jgi:hypothetical protein